MPAYNAEKTLERTWRDLPMEWVDDVVVVDDASRDRTVEVARSLGLHTLVHPRNRGYGGNQKTCYREALSRGRRITRPMAAGLIGHAGAVEEEDEGEGR